VPPLFSVIVPTRDRPELLARALASVLAQTVEDYEVVVVDDGGPRPVEVPEDRRVDLVRRDRPGGAAAARNAGLLRARGRYVTFLDDDDLYTADRLEIALEGARPAAIGICGQRRFGGRGSPRRTRVLEGFVHDHIADAPVPHLGTLVVERERAPAFDERLMASEGIDWWIRATRDLPVTTVRRIGYLSRQHAGPRLNRDLGRRLESTLLLLDIHEPYFSAHPAAAARQWDRAGTFAQRMGDREQARGAFLRSLRCRPGVKAAAHLAATVPPRGAGRRP
jgi:glycosyltransferase involved in cell wall biosynthesis